MLSFLALFAVLSACDTYKLKKNELYDKTNQKTNENQDLKYIKKNVLVKDTTKANGVFPKIKVDGFLCFSSDASICPEGSTHKTSTLKETIEEISTSFSNVKISLYSQDSAELDLNILNNIGLEIESDNPIVLKHVSTTQVQTLAFPKLILTNCAIDITGVSLSSTTCHFTNSVVTASSITANSLSSDLDSISKVNGDITLDERLELKATTPTLINGNIKFSYSQDTHISFDGFNIYNLISSVYDRESYISFQTGEYTLNVYYVQSSRLVNNIQFIDKPDYFDTVSILDSSTGILMKKFSLVLSKVKELTFKVNFDTIYDASLDVSSPEFKLTLQSTSAATSVIYGFNSIFRCPTTIICDKQFDFKEPIEVDGDFVIQNTKDITIEDLNVSGTVHLKGIGFNVNIKAFESSQDDQFPFIFDVSDKGAAKLMVSVAPTEKFRFHSTLTSIVSDSDISNIMFNFFQCTPGAAIPTKIEYVGGEKIFGFWTERSILSIVPVSPMAMLKYASLSDLTYVVCTEAGDFCPKEGVVPSDLAQIDISTGLKKIQIYCGSTVQLLSIPAAQTFELIGLDESSTISLSLMASTQYNQVLIKNIKYMASSLSLNVKKMEVIGSSLKFYDVFYKTTDLKIDFKSLESSDFTSAKKFSSITLIEDTSITEIMVSPTNISIKSTNDLIELPSSSIVLNLNVDTLALNVTEGTTSVSLNLLINLYKSCTFTFNDDWTGVRCSGENTLSINQSTYEITINALESFKLPFSYLGNGKTTENFNTQLTSGNIIYYGEGEEFLLEYQLITADANISAQDSDGNPIRLRINELVINSDCTVNTQKLIIGMKLLISGSSSLSPSDPSDSISYSTDAALSLSSVGADVPTLDFGTNTGEPAPGQINVILNIKDMSSDEISNQFSTDKVLISSSLTNCEDWASKIVVTLDSAQSVSFVTKCLTNPNSIVLRMFKPNICFSADSTSCTAGYQHLDISLNEALGQITSEKINIEFYQKDSETIDLTLISNKEVSITSDSLITITSTNNIAGIQIKSLHLKNVKISASSLEVSITNVKLETSSLVVSKLTVDNLESDFTSLDDISSIDASKSIYLSTKTAVSFKPTINIMSDCDIAIDGINAFKSFTFEMLSGRELYTYLQFDDTTKSTLKPLNPGVNLFYTLKDSKEIENKVFTYSDSNSFVKNIHLEFSQIEELTVKGTTSLPNNTLSILGSGDFTIILNAAKFNFKQPADKAIEKNVKFVEIEDQFVKSFSIENDFSINGDLTFELSKPITFQRNLNIYGNNNLIYFKGLDNVVSINGINPPTTVKSLSYSTNYRLKFDFKHDKISTLTVGNTYSSTIEVVDLNSLETAIISDADIINKKLPFMTFSGNLPEFTATLTSSELIPGFHPSLSVISISSEENKAYVQFGKIAALHIVGCISGDSSLCKENSIIVKGDDPPVIQDIQNQFPKDLLDLTLDFHSHSFIMVAGIFTIGVGGIVNINCDEIEYPSAVTFDCPEKDPTSYEIIYNKVKFSKSTLSQTGGKLVLYDCPHDLNINNCYAYLKSDNPIAISTIGVTGGKSKVIATKLDGVTSVDFSLDRLILKNVEDEFNISSCTINSAVNTEGNFIIQPSKNGESIIFSNETDLSIKSDANAGLTSINLGNNDQAEPPESVKVQIVIPDNSDSLIESIYSQGYSIITSNNDFKCNSWLEKLDITIESTKKYIFEGRCVADDQEGTNSLKIFTKAKIDGSLCFAPNAGSCPQDSIHKTAALNETIEDISLEYKNVKIYLFDQEDSEIDFNLLSSIGLEIESNKPIVITHSSKSTQSLVFTKLILTNCAIDITGIFLSSTTCHFTNSVITASSITANSLVSDLDSISKVIGDITIDETLELKATTPTLINGNIKFSGSYDGHITFEGFNVYNSVTCESQRTAYLSFQTSEFTFVINVVRAFGLTNYIQLIDKPGYFDTISFLDSTSGLMMKHFSITLSTVKELTFKTDFTTGYDASLDVNSPEFKLTLQSTSTADSVTYGFDSVFRCPTTIICDKPFTFTNPIEVRGDFVIQNTKEITIEDLNVSGTVHLKGIGFKVDIKTFESSQDDQFPFIFDVSDKGAAKLKAPVAPTEKFRFHSTLTSIVSDSDISNRMFTFFECTSGAAIPSKIEYVGGEKIFGFWTERSILSIMAASSIAMLNYVSLSDLTYVVCTEAGDFCPKEGIVPSLISVISVPTGLKNMQIYCGATVGTIGMYQAVKSVELIGKTERSVVTSMMAMGFTFDHLLIKNVEMSKTFSPSTKELEVVGSKLSFSDTFQSTSLTSDFKSIEESDLSHVSSFSSIKITEDSTISEVMFSPTNISIKSSTSDLITLPSSSIILSLNVDSLKFEIYEPSFTVSTKLLINLMKPSTLTFNDDWTGVSGNGENTLSIDQSTHAITLNALDSYRQPFVFIGTGVVTSNFKLQATSGEIVYTSDSDEYFLEYQHITADANISAKKIAGEPIPIRINTIEIDDGAHLSAKSLKIGKNLMMAGDSSIEPNSAEIEIIDGVTVDCESNNNMIPTINLGENTKSPSFGEITLSLNFDSLTDNDVELYLKGVEFITGKLLPSSIATQVKLTIAKTQRYRFNIKFVDGSPMKSITLFAYYTDLICIAPSEDKCTGKYVYSSDLSSLEELINYTKQQAHVYIYGQTGSVNIDPSKLSTKDVLIESDSLITINNPTSYNSPLMMTNLKLTNVDLMIKAMMAIISNDLVLINSRVQISTLSVTQNVECEAKSLEHVTILTIGKTFHLKTTGDTFSTNVKFDTNNNEFYLIIDGINAFDSMEVDVPNAKINLMKGEVTSAVGIVRSGSTVNYYEFLDKSEIANKKLIINDENGFMKNLKLNLSSVTELALTSYQVQKEGYISVNSTQFKFDVSSPNMYPLIIGEENTQFELINKKEITFPKIEVNNGITFDSSTPITVTDLVLLDGQIKLKGESCSLTVSKLDTEQVFPFEFSLYAKGIPKLSIPYSNKIDGLQTIQMNLAIDDVVSDSDIITKSIKFLTVTGNEAKLPESINYEIKYTKKIHGFWGTKDIISIETSGAECALNYGNIAEIPYIYCFNSCNDGYEVTSPLEISHLPSPIDLVQVHLSPGSTVDLAVKHILDKLEIIGTDSQQFKLNFDPSSSVSSVKIIKAQSSENVNIVSTASDPVVVLESSHVQFGTVPQDCSLETDYLSLSKTNSEKFATITVSPYDITSIEFSPSSIRLNDAVTVSSEEVFLAINNGEISFSLNNVNLEIAQRINVTFTVNSVINCQGKWSDIATSYIGLNHGTNSLTVNALFSPSVPFNYIGTGAITENLLEISDYQFCVCDGSCEGCPSGYKQALPDAYDKALIEILVLKTEFDIDLSSFTSITSLEILSKNGVKTGTISFKSVQYNSIKLENLEISPKGDAKTLNTKSSTLVRTKITGYDLTIDTYVADQTNLQALSSLSISRSLELTVSDIESITASGKYVSFKIDASNTIPITFEETATTRITLSSATSTSLVISAPTGASLPKMYLLDTKYSTISYSGDAVFSEAKIEITSSSNTMALTTTSATTPISLTGTHTFTIKTSKAVKFFSGLRLSGTCSIENTGSEAATVEFTSLDFTTPSTVLNLSPNIDIKTENLNCYQQSSSDVSFPINYAVTSKRISSVVVTVTSSNLKAQMKFNLKLTEPEKMLDDSDEVCQQWTLLDIHDNQPITSPILVWDDAMIGSNLIFGFSNKFSVFEPIIQDNKIVAKNKVNSNKELPLKVCISSSTSSCPNDEYATVSTFHTFVPKGVKDMTINVIGSQTIHATEEISLGDQGNLVINIDGANVVSPTINTISGRATLRINDKAETSHTMYTFKLYNIDTTISTTSTGNTYKLYDSSIKYIGQESSYNLDNIDSLEGTNVIYATDSNNIPIPANINKLSLESESTAKAVKSTFKSIAMKNSTLLSPKEETDSIGLTVESSISMSNSDGNFPMIDLGTYKSNVVPASITININGLSEEDMMKLVNERKSVITGRSWDCSQWPAKVKIDDDIKTRNFTLKCVTTSSSKILETQGKLVLAVETQSEDPNDQGGGSTPKPKDDTGMIVGIVIAGIVVIAVIIVVIVIYAKKYKNSPKNKEASESSIEDLEEAPDVENPPDESEEKPQKNEEAAPAKVEAPAKKEESEKEDKSESESEKSGSGSENSSDSSSDTESSSSSSESES